MSTEAHHTLTESQLREAQRILASRNGRKGAATQDRAHRVRAGRLGGLAKAKAMRAKAKLAKARA